MNCPKCGNALISGLQKCVCCGTPITNSEQITGNGDYTSSSAHIRKKPIHYVDTVFSSFGNFPKMLLRSLTDPGELLRELVTTRNYTVSAIVVFLVLVGAFLCGLCCTTGAVGSIFSVLNLMLGPKANTATPQGISYVAGRVRMACGGTALLCQAIMMVTGAIAYLVYICKICRVQFTWQLAWNFLGVTHITLFPCQLVGIIFSFWTPWILLIMIALSFAVTHIQACSTLALITSIPDKYLFRGKISCVVLALLLSLLVLLLVAPPLLSGAWRRVVVLISGMIGSI